MSADEPRRLGRYELLEVLGHGAMGVVYKAQDAFLDRVVAVKTYRQDIPITNDVKRRFDREVRTASKLVHPNIVVVLDGGLEQGVPFLAMEFVDGPTLGAELRRRGRLPVEEAMSIILDIAEGLEFAHAHGVVHRDLKPANVLLSAGRAKIADFGVAKLMSSGTAATATAVGTPSYMAPEQIEGRSVDTRTDVFALGILAYELLTGRAPFTGEGWTQVLYQIMNVEPPAPTSIDPKLPAALDTALGRALAKDPAKRTPDVGTLAAELRGAFSGEPSARPPSPAETISLPSLVAPEPAAPGGLHGQFEGEFDAFRELAPKKTQWSLVGPVIALMALLAVTVGAIVYYRSTLRAPMLLPAGTPVVMATAAAAPTQASAEPTALATEEPRPEPTAAPRATAAPKPTVAPRPTAAPKPTPAPAKVEPTVAPPPPPPVVAVKSTIDVISDPPGADVTVNGVAKGRTPLRIADLDAGSYDFEVSKEGFTTFRKTAQLEERSDYTMRITLPPTVNSLRILSTPRGVTVALNGAVKGRTPITVGSLLPGHYEVSAELEGYPTQTMSIDLKHGELREIRFTFAANQGGQ
jgi:eukaryotic-like serine/threonine-protein kinase